MNFARLKRLISKGDLTLSTLQSILPIYRLLMTVTEYRLPAVLVPFGDFQPKWPYDMYDCEKWSIPMVHSDRSIANVNLFALNWFMWHIYSFCLIFLKLRWCKKFKCVLLEENDLCGQFYCCWRTGKEMKPAPYSYFWRRHHDNENISLT